MDGHDLVSGEDATFLLVTCGISGWPHVAMLSVGEVLASSDRQLRLALWPGSHTTDNLTRGEMGLLMAVIPGAAYHLRLRFRRLSDATIDGAPRALFVATLEEVLEDVVDYATITRGIAFQLRDPTTSQRAWAAALAALRQADA